MFSQLQFLVFQSFLKNYFYFLIYQNKKANFFSCPSARNILPFVHPLCNITFTVSSWIQCSKMSKASQTFLLPHDLLNAALNYRSDHRFITRGRRRGLGSLRRSGERLRIGEWDQERGAWRTRFLYFYRSWGWD